MSAFGATESENNTDDTVGHERSLNNDIEDNGNMMRLAVDNGIANNDHKLERTIEGLVHQLEANRRIATIDRFQGLNPPSFVGSPNPVDAESWLLEIEKIFGAMPCTERQKVEFATYNLNGEAYQWWLTVSRREPTMVWARFVNVFNEKYFPQYLRDVKIAEFFMLTQEKLTVAQYEAKFTELSRYASHAVRDEGQKARKFEMGLRWDIKGRVELFRLPSYNEVVDRALIAEKGINEGRKQLVEKRRQKEDRKNVGNFSRGGPNKTVGFKKNGEVKNYKRGLSVNQNGENPRFPKGRMNHYHGVCYRCGESGHTSRNCLAPKPNYQSQPNAVVQIPERTNRKAKVRNYPVPGSIYPCQPNASVNIPQTMNRKGRAFVLVPEVVPEGAVFPDVSTGISGEEDGL